MIVRFDSKHWQVGKIDLLLETHKDILEAFVFI